MLRGFEQRHLILMESDWLVTAGINNRFVKVYGLIAILLVATTLISPPPKKKKICRKYFGLQHLIYQNEVDVDQI